VLPAGRTAAAAAIAAAAPQHITLTATGTPQPSKKRAEQAAAAAALSTPAMQALLASLRAPQQQQLLHPAPSKAAPVQILPLATGQASATPSPTALLHDLVTQAGWCLEPIIPVQLGGPSHLPLFEASVTINGHLLAVGQGNSKADASHTAAAHALECMQPTAAPAPPGSSGSNGSSSSSIVSAAEVQEASLFLFQQLAHQASIVSPTISPAKVTLTALCTFLIQQGSSKPQVVALGTGTGFYAGGYRNGVSTGGGCGSQTESRMLDMHTPLSLGLHWCSSVVAVTYYGVQLS
jgi:hypothetical protein